MQRQKLSIKHRHNHNQVQSYVIVSQLLCVLLSVSDNAVCVNDIPERTRSESAGFTAAADIYGAIKGAGVTQ